MPSQILVPLDGSAFGEHALDYAIEAAERAHATLHFVKVHTPFGAPARPEPPTDRRDHVGAEVRRSELEYLQRTAEYGRLEGLRVCIALLDGAIVSALEQYTKDANIDLVIMTTHGRGGLSRAWLGSVADSLIRSVDVPLVLLRPRAGRFGPRAGPCFALNRILVPLDGSPLAETVLPPATELANLTGARFTLLQVVAPPLEIPPSMVVPGFSTESGSESVRAAASYLDSVAAQLRSIGYEVDTTVVVQLTPAVAIVEQAAEQEADLIAMATHGRSGWSRLALGSVADKVLRSTSTPLFVVRPDAARVPHSRSMPAGPAIVR